MITHEYYCPIGCLIEVTHQSQISEHQEEHLRNILNIIKYRKDDISAYKNIQTYIEQCLSFVSMRSVNHGLEIAKNELVKGELIVETR